MDLTGCSLSDEIELSHKLGVSMRDPKRIKAIIDELRKMWTSNSDLRLGQLVVNVVGPKEATPEMFYIEDDEFMARLQKLREKNEAP